MHPEAAKKMVEVGKRALIPNHRDRYEDTRICKTLGPTKEIGKKKKDYRQVK